MTEKQIERIRKAGLNPSDFKPKPKEPVHVSSLHITREDFDLLDVQDENVIYYIIEEDGAVTVRKGE